MDHIRRHFMGKRSANGLGTVYQRRDGTWAAQATVAPYKRATVYADTQAEVVEKLNKLKQERDQGLQVPDRRLTVGTWLDRWLDESARPRVKPSTYKSYVLHVEKHLKPHIQREQLTALSASSVRRMLKAHTEAGMAPASVRRILAVLRRALEVARQDGLVARNVAALVDGPRVEHREVVPYSVEQARLVVEAVKADRLGPLFTLIITTGLRSGEARGLSWSDLDLDAATLTVRKTAHRDGKDWSFDSPKSERSRRTVALPPLTVNRLREFRTAQSIERIAMGPAWKDRHDLVFTSMRGAPLDDTFILKRFKKIVAEAGLPVKNIHALRHSYASYLIFEGLNIREVMEALGHSQISITMNTYAHILPNARRAAADAIHRTLGD
jgi:integrase